MALRSGAFPLHRLNEEKRKLSEPTFTDKMQSLVAKELSDAHSDPDRLGEAIERLANSLGLVIAVATKGNQFLTNDAARLRPVDATQSPDRVTSRLDRPLAGP